MEICIIGCTGYLGSKISEHLYKKGHQLYGVCRKFPKDEIKFKNYFHKIKELPETINYKKDCFTKN